MAAPMMMCWVGWHFNDALQVDQPASIHVFRGKNKKCRCGKTRWED